MTYVLIDDIWFEFAWINVSNNFSAFLSVWLFATGFRNIKISWQFSWVSSFRFWDSNFKCFESSIFIVNRSLPIHRSFCAATFQLSFSNRNVSFTRKYVERNVTYLKQIRMFTLEVEFLPLLVLNQMFGRLLLYCCDTFWWRWHQLTSLWHLCTRIRQNTTKDLLLPHQPVL